MFNNLKFPVLIISSPRTGSTILGDYLSVENNYVKYFSEPHFYQDDYNEFLEYSNRSNDYILKIHAKDIIHYDLNLKDFYLIRIRRKNIVDQIASYYLAHIRQKFGGYDPDSIEYLNYENSTIDYNIRLLKIIIRTTLIFNKHLEMFDKQFDVTFDQDLWYEDLNSIFIDDKKYRVSRTAYPKNYDLLKELIVTDPVVKMQHQIVL